MEGFRFILNNQVSMEETLEIEFKEVKGGNPVNIIKNAVDEYAVAFLNRVGGSIFWGIRDSDRSIVGVELDDNQRNNLRKVVDAQLANIQPPVSPSVFRIPLHRVFEDEDSTTAIPDLYVIEVEIQESDDDEIYFTGGSEAFIKTDSGKTKLSGLKLQDEILIRLRRKTKHSKADTTVGTGFLPGFSPVLRRARLVSIVTTGAQVLWVDDNPGNNIYERMALKSLGIAIDVAVSTQEALQMLELQSYDAIVSDILRSGESDAGLKLLRSVRSRGSVTQLVFYVRQIDEWRGKPKGSFGITKYPDELMHLILDILERVRI